MSAVGLMRLVVHLPTAILVEAPVQKIVAEAENGYFCLLPRHVDFVTALVPGISSFVLAGGELAHAALDEGVLLKRGREVFVSALRGVRGDDLDELATLVREQYLALDEQERRSRSALARLEAGALRGFQQLQGEGRG